MGGPWTEALTRRLEALWQAGLSASDCARELGLGLTRNSIIGKIHRLGLCHAYREPRKRGRIMRAKPRPSVRTKRRKIIPENIPEQPFTLALADLKPEHCRWPEGDGPFRFCGQQRLELSSYCDRHHKLAHHRFGTHA